MRIHCVLETLTGTHSFKLDEERMNQPRRLGVKLCAKTVSAADSFSVAAAAPVFSFVAIVALRFWPGRWPEVSEKIRYLKRSCTTAATN